jgi:S-adenosylmethionine-diacylglycerol 3-amino-3-carboxypropyl transferase
MRSEASQRADFSGIRYAQCWEDADVLLEALDIQPGACCLSIASAGENTLALLTRDPGKVLAIDLSPAQLHVLALRVAAYRALAYDEMLGFLGSTKCADRMHLYKKCREYLACDAQAFWDARPEVLCEGICAAGKFDHYFRLFRRRVLPMVHSRRRVESLLTPKLRAQRLDFYEREWNNLRWRLMFRVFFSRFVMGRMGRDPEFFRYVEGNVADRILARTCYALTELDPATNPYVRWILEERHIPQALPCALRPENFERIRQNLDRLQWRGCSLEDAIESDEPRFDCFNLSDIFEYMSEENYEQLLRLLVKHSNRGARLAYWNMLVPRHRPESLSDSLAPLAGLSEQLFAKDQAFFYSAFVVEEVR